jgi:hypothetical protein
MLIHPMSGTGTSFTGLLWKRGILRFAGYVRVLKRRALSIPYVHRVLMAPLGISYIFPLFFWKPTFWRRILSIFSGKSNEVMKQLAVQKQFRMALRGETSWVGLYIHLGPVRAKPCIGRVHWQTIMWKYRGRARARERERALSWWIWISCIWVEVAGTAQNWTDLL